MIYNGTESNKVLKRDNILDLFCASQYLSIKGKKEFNFTLTIAIFFYDNKVFTILLF